MRFEFGRNWHEFIKQVTEERICVAQNSIQDMLGKDFVRGSSFLDIGCGSGLFSLAASRLGARSVHSFDYDQDSVTAAYSLKEKYAPKLNEWKIEKGDALDLAYIRSLGEFDIVYSWGVLHHTGNMWQALANAADTCRAGGKLCIALYNEQGFRTELWKLIKKTYNFLPGVLKYAVLLPVFVRLWGPAAVRDAVKLHPWRTWREYRLARGMSPWRDVVDWVGGYPFEAARPDDVIEFYGKLGFTLVNEKRCGGGHGNNEFVFEKKL